MRYWFDRTYARWGIRAVRSMPPGSPFAALRYPPIVATLALLGIWGASLLAFMGLDGGAVVSTGVLVVSAVAMVALTAWRILAEALPVMPLLNYIVVMGSCADDAPESADDRLRETVEEWSRRVGADVAGLLPPTWAAWRRRAVINWGGAAAFVALVTAAMLVLGSDAASSVWLWLALAGAYLVHLWFSFRAEHAWELKKSKVRSALAAVFGEPLPPGPPADPDRFRAWVASTTAGGAAPTLHMEGE